MFRPAVTLRTAAVARLSGYVPVLRRVRDTPRVTVYGPRMTDRHTNLRCNIPDPQKKALMRLIEARKEERKQRWSLGQMISEAIEEHFGIRPDGSDGFAESDR